VYDRIAYNEQLCRKSISFFLGTLNFYRPTHNIWKEQIYSILTQDKDSILQDRPNVSPCFEDTVLVWIPYGFLWIVSLPFTAYLCRKERDQPLPFHKLQIMKKVSKYYIGQLHFSCIFYIISKHVITRPFISSWLFSNLAS
jgi:hypothetical protein